MSLVTGILGGACSTAALYPQVFRAARARSTREVSWYTVALMVAGSAIWACHGVTVGSGPIVICNAVALVAQIVFAVFKGFGERNGRRPADEVA